jgi:hypothetical protein
VGGDGFGRPDLAHVPAENVRQILTHIHGLPPLVAREPGRRRQRRCPQRQQAPSAAHVSAPDAPGWTTRRVNAVRARR